MSQALRPLILSGLITTFVLSACGGGGGGGGSSSVGGSPPVSSSGSGSGAGNNDGTAAVVHEGSAEERLQAHLNELAPGCTGAPDEFPSFVYSPVAVIPDALISDGLIAQQFKSEAIVVSSSDGCRREVLVPPPPAADMSGGGQPIAFSLSGIAFHLTSDRKAGVVLWAEDPKNDNRDVVRWRRFKVTEDGSLELEPPQDLLTAEGIPEGDYLHYFGPTIWGNADHSRLYLSLQRVHVADDRVTTLAEDWRLYEFQDGSADYTDMRVLTDVPARETWMDCNGVVHPQFVAGCYVLSSGGNWNQSGSRLYARGRPWDHDLGDWHDWSGVVRIDIDNRYDHGDLKPLMEWTLAPHLVFTGRYATPDQGTLTPGIFSRGLRPKHHAGEPDLVVMRYWRVGSGWTRAIANADQCVAEYVARGLTNGDSVGPSDLWLDCIVEGEFYMDQFDLTAWQFPDAVLDGVGGIDPEMHVLIRRYVSGALAGTSEALIKGATNHVVSAPVSQ